MEGELIAPTPTKEKLTATMIARKNCLVLIAKNLKKGSSPEQVEKELRTLIGEKNIVNVYFLRAEAGMHTGVANVELLNAHVYKKFVKKSHKMQHKYVKFNPHPRSRDGIAAPSDVALREWGFHDVLTALANTVEAIENATAVPKRRVGSSEEISTLVKEAIAEGSQSLKQELRADMKCLREEVLAEVHTYTDIMTQDLRIKIDGQLDNMDTQFKALMESLSNTRKMLNHTPQMMALPPPEPRHSN
jgi:Glu-tRNA(Gln) amidotransferase subunit E-like FAD-binding protein